MKDDLMLHQKWEKVSKHLKKKYPKDRELWLDYIKYLTGKEGKLYLSVPNSVYKERISEKYMDDIKEYIWNRWMKRVQVEVMIQEGLEDENEDGNEDGNEDENEDGNEDGSELESLDLETKSSYSKIQKEKINSRVSRKKHYYKREKNQTFEQFVVGQNSRLAHAAAYRIAEFPGKEYNPFFVYGGVGLGKTHLMQAIGAKVSNSGLFLDILYVTSEEFTNEYVNSLHKGRVHTFRLKYRNSDVLLIDDIQFLEGKEGIQEEIFHTFNILKDSGKQMVFTSDRSPIELKTITDRLISRFKSGLVADIKPPDLETRKAILKQKTHQYGLDLEEEIIQHLALHITNNVRDLEAGIIKLKSIKILLKEKITIKTVEEHLKEVLNDKPKQKNLTVEEIQKEVANYYNISQFDMKSKKRTESVVRPRQVAIFLAKNLTHRSTKELGNEFGGRNHSTIIASYQKIGKKLEVSESIRNDIEHLKEKILRKHSVQKNDSKEVGGGRLD